VIFWGIGVGFIAYIKYFLWTIPLTVFSKMKDNKNNTHIKQNGGSSIKNVKLIDKNQVQTKIPFPQAHKPQTTPSNTTHKTNIFYTQNFFMRISFAVVKEFLH
jgi:hypothetical protein